MGQIRRWNLYVDESGDFSRDDSDPAVVGLLAAEYCKSVSVLRLKQALRQAMPEVGWPIHATYTRIPVMYAFWEEFHSENRAVSVDGWRERSGVAVEILLFLEELLPESFERVKIAVEEGKDPDWDSVQKLDCSLKKVNGEFYAWCHRRKRQARSGLMRVLEAMAAEAERNSLWFVISAEASRGDTFLKMESGPLAANLEMRGKSKGGRSRSRGSLGSSTAAGNEPTIVADPAGTPASNLFPLNDRYLVLLACCLQRVAHVLSTLGGEHLVAIRACRRRVAHEILPAKVDLRPQDVGRAAVQATGRKDRKWLANGGSVRFVPMATHAFRANVHPCLVVADYAANEARRHVRRYIGLAKLRRRIENALAVSVSMDDRHEPSIAASGVAQQHVERAFTDMFSAGDACPSEGPLFEPEVRLWAREQAFAWASYFTKE
jgi:hypothetical protein